LSFVVQVRRAAELDVAEAQTWYEAQRAGLGREFYSEVSQIIDRLAQTPLLYAVVYQDVRRAVVRRFPYFIWFRVVNQTVAVLACSHWRQESDKTISRF